MIYVEPGHGAWLWWGSAGSLGVVNGANGISTVAVDSAVPLKAGNATLKEFSPGGILVAVDWQRMRVLAARLDAAMLGGAR